MREAKAMLEYGKFFGLTDVFGEYTSGIKTADDKNLISFKEEEFKKKIDNFDKQFVKNISYRPFDNRKIYYDTKLVERPRLAIMQNMLKVDNIGLIFPRLSESENFDYGFISEGLIDISVGGKNSGSETYLAPLYLHKNDLEGERKEVNFKPEFAKMVAQKFENPTPEEVLAYIYAVLHSPKYRKKYLEFLKIDFPRIPFDCDKTSFKKLANIGQELIDAHLIRKIPKSKIGEPESDGAQNFVMEKVVYNEEKQRLCFNKICYFADVSPSVWEFKIGGYQVLDKYLK